MRDAGRAEGTPEAVVNKLHSAVMTALETKAVQERFVQFGFLASSQSPAQLASEFKAETVTWGETIKKSGIKLP